MKFSESENASHHVPRLMEKGYAKQSWVDYVLKEDHRNSTAEKIAFGQIVSLIAQ